MKRFLSAVLICALLAVAAAAESVKTVNDIISQMGYVAMTAKNQTGLKGCWYTEGDVEDTLQWSDAKKVYTVTARRDAGLWEAYANIIGLYEWDTCAYTVGNRAQYAYNAPELNAVHNYKTLKNYARYVTEYISQLEAVYVAAPNSYVLNTSSKKFHRPDCYMVERIKAENRKTTRERRDAIIAQGYSPCKLCNP